MDERNIISYIYFKTGFFDFTGFNFDNKYLFDIEIDREKKEYHYTLHISKRRVMQPAGFWGKNISAFNVITGRNGAGKTTFFSNIINNIADRGITAMSGECILYIINYNGEYVIDSNLKFLSICIDENASDINIKKSKFFWEEESTKTDGRLSRDNNYFFRNFIYFSNYFGELRIQKDNSYTINISKDKEVEAVLKSLKTISNTSIQNELKKTRNNKVLEYLSNNSFKTLSAKLGIQPYNLLIFKTDKDTPSYKAFIGNEENRDGFTSDLWIGKKRYEKEYFFGDYHLLESKINFESAINRFALMIVLQLTESNKIGEDILNKFLYSLKETEDKTGPELLIELLGEIEDTETREYMEIIDFLTKSEPFVSYWQSEDEFAYEWQNESLNIVKRIVNQNKKESFFTCNMAGSGGNGYYSSGEDSKTNLLISLYDALTRMGTTKAGNDKKNIVLMLDEIDAFFHPEYQMSLVNEVIEIVSNVFEGYNVQIIMSCNTPLEISDFPASCITYLENGTVHSEHNSLDTFGNNVLALLKNNFYIRSTMGDFAKKKINQVISFLCSDTHDEINKDEVKYILSIIGEPIIKKKLLEMYYKKYPEDASHEEEITIYREKVQELQDKIKDGRIIDVTDLNKLEEELIGLTRTIKKIRGENTDD